MYLQSLARRDPWSPPVVASFPPEIQRTSRRSSRRDPESESETEWEWESDGESETGQDSGLLFATDIDALQTYIASVLNAAIWSLRGGAWYVVHKRGRDRVVLGIRESLDTCRTWLRQHADAYPQDVADDMRTLARLLRDILENETADDLHTELLSIWSYLYDET